MTDAPASSLDLLGDLAPDEKDRARTTFMVLAKQVGLDLAGAFDRLQAGATLAQAIDLPAGTADLLYDRAYRFIVAGRTDRAAPIFHTLSLMEPREAKHWLGLGIAQAREGEIGIARAALQRACELAPEWAVARFHLTDLLVRSEDWARASDELAVFDRLSKPDVPDPMLNEAERLRLAIGVGLRRLGTNGRGPGGVGA